VVNDLSHECLRVLLREEGMPFQVLETWKQATNPDVEAKKIRFVEPCATARRCIWHSFA